MTVVMEVADRTLRFSNATLRAAGVECENAAVARIRGTSMEKLILDGAAIGFDRADMQERREGSVVVEMLNRYHRPLRAGDLAVVMSGLAAFTAKTVIFTHFLFEAETGTLAACAEAVGMKFDQKIRKIMSFSADDQARLAARKLRF